jgi:cysteine desulfurase/selenocysteine lyase
VRYTWAREHVGAGDVVLISQMEHHSNIVPWQLLCEERGARLDYLQVDDHGRLDLAELDDRLADGAVRLVAVAHVSNVLGTINPVADIAERVHAAGALLLLDGSQAVPQLPVDVTATGADFYAFTGHKMLGPTGIGVLWARRDLLEEMPPFMGGGSMIGRVSLEEITWAPVPRRFEAGTPPIGPAVGLGAACRWMMTLDWSAVGTHEMGLTQRMMDGLAGIKGTRLIGPAGLQGRLPVISFTLDGVHPHDTAQILDSYGVAVRAGHHCAQPLMDRLDLAGTTRASIAPYNNAGDVDALLEGVGEALRRFA